MCFPPFYFKHNLSCVRSMTALSIHKWLKRRKLKDVNDQMKLNWPPEPQSANVEDLFIPASVQESVLRFCKKTCGMRLSQEIISLPINPTATICTSPCYEIFSDRDAFWRNNQNKKNSFVSFIKTWGFWLKINQTQLQQVFWQWQRSENKTNYLLIQVDKTQSHHWISFHFGRMSRNKDFCGNHFHCWFPNHQRTWFSEFYVLSLMTSRVVAL